MIDYQSAADQIGVDVAAVKAIAEVERGVADDFLSHAAPLIAFLYSRA